MHVHLIGTIPNQSIEVLEALGFVVAGSVVVIVVAVIGYRLIIHPRKYPRRQNRGQNRGRGGDAGELTLVDLRRLHKDGQLSDKEFEVLKVAMITQTLGQATDVEADGVDQENNDDDGGDEGEAADNDEADNQQNGT